jgi:hypothetical protein
MAKSNKGILIGGAVIALFFIANKVFNLNLFDKKVKIDIKPGSRNPDIIGISLIPPTLGYLRLPVNVVFTNPTSKTFKMTVPYVQVFVNGQKAAESAQTNIERQITAGNSTTIEIEFKIPVSLLVNNAIEYINKYLSEGLTRFGKQLNFQIDCKIDGLNVTQYYNYSI